MLSLIAALALTAGPLADAPLRMPVLTLPALPAAAIFPSAADSASESRSCVADVIAVGLLGTAAGALLGSMISVRDGGEGFDGTLFAITVGAGAVGGGLFGYYNCPG